MKRGRWRCASPAPPDLIGVDDFVHGDDSQSKALGLANEHAIEGIAMMLGEFLEEAAIVDGGREKWHADELQLVGVKLVPRVQNQQTWESEMDREVHGTV